MRIYDYTKAMMERRFALMRGLLWLLQSLAMTKKVVWIALIFCKNQSNDGVFFNLSKRYLA